MRRRVLYCLAGFLLCFSFLPTAQAASSVPRVDPALARQIRTQSGALLVLIHAPTVRDARSAAAAHGLRVTTSFRRVGVAAAVGTPRQIAALTKDGRVTYLEANRKLSFMLDTSHKATRGEELYKGFTATTTEPQPPICPKRNPKKCQPQPPATVTHNVQSDGTGTSVAIIDSGVDGTHPMFNKNGVSKVVKNLKIACHDIACPVNNGLGDAQDPFWIDVTNNGNDTDTSSGGGHGTHVAGIAAGYEVTLADGRVLHGAAPGAKIVALSVGSAISVSGAGAALNWVLEHHNAPCGDGVDPAVCPPIKVVNNSYGPTGGGDYNAGGLDEELSDALAADGVTVVWANGNDGGDGTSSVSNPPGQSPVRGVISVANYDNVDTATRDGWLAPSSSRGEDGKVATYPDISAPGTDITSACRQTLPVCSTGWDSRDPDYNTISGTSMATPHIVGIVAQLAALNPALSPASIETILEDTAHRFAGGGFYETDTRNTESTTLTSFDKGHGLVDVVEAATAALAYSSPPAASQVCTADGPVIVDRAGDASLDVTSTPLPSDPTVDVTRGRLVRNGDASFTYTLDVPGLIEGDPTAANGTQFDTTFSYAGVPLTLSAGRLLGTLGVFNDLFTLTNDATGTSVDVAGTWDVPNHAIVMTMTGPNLVDVGVATPFAAGNVLDEFNVTAWKTQTALNAGADLASQFCPYTLGKGALPPDSVPTKAPSAATGSTFYLHHKDECVATDGFMDRTDSAGDDDGCGSIAPEAMSGAYLTSFPSTVATGADLPVGSVVTGTVYLATDAPGEIEVTATLRNGTVTVGQGSSDAVLSTGGEGIVDFILAGTQYTAVPFTFTTAQAVGATDVLTMDIGITGSPTFFFGYEGDHASQFKVEPPAAP